MVKSLKFSVIVFHDKNMTFSSWYQAIVQSSCTELEGLDTRLVPHLTVAVAQFTPDSSVKHADVSEVVSTCFKVTQCVITSYCIKVTVEVHIVFRRGEVTRAVSVVNGVLIHLRERVRKGGKKRVRGKE